LIIEVPMNTTGIIGHTRQLDILNLLFWNKTIPHTMLFTGMTGIGKKLVARRFLTALFCGAKEPPCLECPACLQAAGRTLPDIIELSPDDKGNIPIGDTDRSEEGSVRWLIDRLSKKSLSGKFGVLIDGAELISVPGQNALLKTIEEPQEGAHIIITTSKKSLILPTIQSRCMELSFNPLSSEEIKEVLARRSGSSDPEFISALSGGSAEIALILSKSDTRDMISEICGEIGQHLSKGERLKFDFTSLQKKISMDNLLSILINIYRAILSSSIADAPLDSYLTDIIIEDRQKLIKLIKILLALKKGLANNLNIRNALKGMLYSIDTFDGFGLPKLDYMQ
jgi:DNA polymerase III subunit delta'